LFGRAKEAGGVLPLLSNGLKAVTTGIGGITRASLAFIATPIGAVIAAIGLALSAVISFLTKTQSGIDAVTSVTRPLQAIFTALSGVLTKVGKALFETFTNPKQAIADFANFIKQNLINRFTALGEIIQGVLDFDFKRVTNGALQAVTGVENVTDKIQGAAKETGKFLDEAIKKGQEIDRLQKEIERNELAYQKAQITTGDKLDELELIVKNTSKSFKERAAAAEEQIRLTEELSLKEQEIVKAKIRALELEYSLKDAKEITIAEQQKLIDLEKELDQAQDRGLEARIEKSRVLSGLQKEQQAQAAEAAKEAEAARQKVLDDALAKSQAELNNFLSNQGIKAKSIEEQLAIAEKVFKKELEINQRAFEASKKTEVDKLNLQTANNEARNKLLQSQTDIVLANAEVELEIFKQTNQSKLDQQKFLNEESAKLEKDRLDRIAQENRDYQALRLEQGVIDERTYGLEIAKIDEENNQAKLAVEEQRKIAEKERQAIDLENARENRVLAFEEQLAQQTEELNRQRALELENANKTGADKALINKKFDTLILDNKKALKNAELALTADTLGQIRGLLKENTVVAKTLGVAEATINTYLGATKALATLPPPFGAIQAGITIATGLAQVSKISGVKFEDGGTMMVGGNRHAQGGTKFVGSDGTRFEAERGELIGVLNRSASRQFMAFNDAFGKKGQIGTSYAANGGIIARGIDSGVNDIAQQAVLTASAISQLPSPVVTVEDINTVGNRVAVIENGANF